MIDVIGWILREYRGLDGECPGRGVFLFIRNWLYGMMQYDNQATVLTQGICHDIIILNLWE